jgi:hypothetical protein
MGLAELQAKLKPDVEPVELPGPNATVDARVEGVELREPNATDDAKTVELVELQRPNATADLLITCGRVELRGASWSFEIQSSTSQNEQPQVLTNPCGACGASFGVTRSAQARAHPRLYRQTGLKQPPQAPQAQRYPKSTILHHCLCRDCRHAPLARQVSGWTGERSVTEGCGAGLQAVAGLHWCAWYVGPEVETDVVVFA